MEINKLTENLIKIINEERYYYGEINYIKNNMNAIVNTIKTTEDLINETIDASEENEYNDLQISTLKATIQNLNNATKLVDSSNEALDKNFPSRIGVLTPEQKAYIEQHKDELEKETEAKEEFTDGEVNQISKDVADILATLGDLKTRMVENESVELVNRMLERLTDDINELGIEVDEDIIG